MLNGLCRSPKLGQVVKVELINLSKKNKDMAKQSRRKFSADFKAKVVIEALKERNTIEDLAMKHELHPNQITTWKKEFLSNAHTVFENSKSGLVREDNEKEKEELFKQIGVQNVEINWLKKKLGINRLPNFE